MWDSGVLCGAADPPEGGASGAGPARAPPITSNAARDHEREQAVGLGMVAWLMESLKEYLHSRECVEARPFPLPDLRHPTWLMDLCARAGGRA